MFADFSGVGMTHVKHVSVGRGLTASEPAFSALPCMWGPQHVPDVDVFAQSATPSATATGTNFAFFPQTDNAGQDTASNANSTWNGGRWPFLWSNRSNAGPTGNIRANSIFPGISYPVTGENCRANYTTHALANTATLVRAMHWLGYTMDELTAAAGGMPIRTHATLEANPAAYFTTTVADPLSPGTNFRVTLDAIWLNDESPSTAMNLEGITLDYEVQDVRSTAVTTSFFTSVANACHAKGKKLFVYTNPLTGATASNNGISDANANGFLTIVDYITVAWAPATTAFANYTTDFDAQIARLSAGAIPMDYSKVAIMFPFGHTADNESTLLEAETARAIMKRRGITAVMLFRDGAVQGGMSPNRLVNQKIAALAFGA